VHSDISKIEPSAGAARTSDPNELTDAVLGAAPLGFKDSKHRPGSARADGGAAGAKTVSAAVGLPL